MTQDISYNPNNKSLDFRWETGSLYRYSNVPAEAAEQVTDGDSFRQHIAPHLKTRKATDDEPVCPCGLVHWYCQPYEHNLGRTEY